MTKSFLRRPKKGKEKELIISKYNDVLSRKKHISFCITCKGRLHHLKETLPKNIKDNKSRSVEFVVLDYNSDDGVAEFIKQYEEEMFYGKISYCRESTKAKFDMSHAKNMAHRLAKGEILISLDADAYTGPFLYDFIKEEFDKDQNIGIISKRNSGFLVVKNEHFKQCRGYDEDFVGYGFEDLDLKKRMEIIGIKLINCSDNAAKRILPQHGYEDRQGCIESIRKNRKISRRKIFNSIRRNQDGYGMGRIMRNFTEWVDLGVN